MVQASNLAIQPGGEYIVKHIFCSAHKDSKKKIIPQTNWENNKVFINKFIIKLININIFTSNLMKIIQI